MKKLAVMTVVAIKMKKVIFKIFAAVVLAVVFVACGGGRLDGTYISTEDDDIENAFLIISGNKMKIEVGGSVVEEITFQRVEKSYENGISRGVFIMTEKGRNNETNYEFDGNRLTFDDMVFIRKNATPKKSGNSGSIGKQAAEEACGCAKVDGLAALVCLGAWVEKYEEYLENAHSEEVLKTPVFKDKKNQKDFEKTVEKCKQR